uniref:Uncharacterized protein n=1 Tax=Cyprinus carpio TaxID=7962 RepID=A0A8C2FF91_CYPCA
MAGDEREEKETFTVGCSGDMASSYHQEMQEVFRNNNKSREFPAHSAKVHSVAWSCDGKRLASGSFDKTASVFVLEKDRLMWLFVIIRRDLALF